MPDVTMCDGHKCPKKFQCYRHMATRYLVQCYTRDLESHCIDDDFSWFIPINGQKTREIQEENGRNTWQSLEEK